MARKQKASVLEKFLDMIGLAENVQEDDVHQSFEDDFDEQPVRGRNGSRKSRFGDEFDGEPRMSRAQNKRSTSSTASSPSAGSRFEDDWEDDAESRPNYGARTKQRAQSKTRPAAGRYGGEQGGTSVGSKTDNRYESTREGDGRYRSGYSHQRNDYGRYGDYKAGVSRYDEAGYGAYGETYSKDSSVAANSAGQTSRRHQTIIFKIRSIEECKNVILALIDKNSVLLNLDDLDSMQTQRALDTISGASYAIGATLSRASDRTWLISPSTVDVKDDPGAPSDSEYRSKYSM